MRMVVKKIKKIKKIKYPYLGLRKILKKKNLKICVHIKNLEESYRTFKIFKNFRIIRGTFYAFFSGFIREGWFFAMCLPSFASFFSYQGLILSRLRVNFWIFLLVYCINERIRWDFFCRKKAIKCLLEGFSPYEIFLKNRKNEKKVKLDPF